MHTLIGGPSEVFLRIRLCFVAVCAAVVGGQWVGATVDRPFVASPRMLLGAAKGGDRGPGWAERATIAQRLGRRAGSHP